MVRPSVISLNWCTAEYQEPLARGGTFHTPVPMENTETAKNKQKAYTGLMLEVFLLCDSEKYNTSQRHHSGLLTSYKNTLFLEDSKKLKQRQLNSLLSACRTAEHTASH